jgi:hypothetical protein
MQATPKVSLSQEELEALTKRTQDGGTEVVQAKAGKVGLVVGLGPHGTNPIVNQQNDVLCQETEALSWCLPQMARGSVKDKNTRKIQELGECNE